MASLSPLHSDGRTGPEPGQNVLTSRQKQFLTIVFYCFLRQCFIVFFNYFLVLDHHSTFVLLIAKIIAKIMIIRNPVSFAAIQNSRGSRSVLAERSAQQPSCATRLKPDAMSQSAGQRCPNKTCCDNGDILLCAVFVLLKAVTMWLVQRQDLTFNFV